MKALAEGYARGKLEDGQDIIVGFWDGPGGAATWRYAREAPTKCFAPEPFKKGQWIRNKANPGWVTRFDSAIQKHSSWEPCPPPRWAWVHAWPGDEVKLVENPCGPNGKPGEGLLAEADLACAARTFTVLLIERMSDGPAIVLGHGDQPRVWPWNVKLAEPEGRKP